MTPRPRDAAPKPGSVRRAARAGPNGSSSEALVYLTTARAAVPESGVLGRDRGSGRGCRPDTGSVIAHGVEQAQLAVASRPPLGWSRAEREPRVAEARPGARERRQTARKVRKLRRSSWRRRKPEMRRPRTGESRASTAGVVVLPALTVPDHRRGRSRLELELTKPARIDGGPTRPDP